jgi:SAM-dependent methyltransferase
MSANTERDYVLGTHDEEIDRLGLQHRVWQPMAHAAWQRAGIAAGARVLDVGAGPGYATIDLAELVGSAGEVVAIERSSRFARIGADVCRERGFAHVRFLELDLMTDPLPVRGFDAAWIRWVASFVSSPERLVRQLADAVRPGGCLIFHEYIDYGTFRLVPSRTRFEEFVQQVMASWREAGGEPNVAELLPALLAASGCQLRSLTPLVYAVRPQDAMWRWPAVFLDVNLKRMLELDRVDQEWASQVRQEFTRAEANSETIMITPMVLEILATVTPNR